VGSPRTASSEARLGFIVLLTVGAAFATVTIAPTILGPARVSVSIHFPFQQGVAGIKPKSPILLAGLNVGLVDSVEFVPVSGETPAFFRANCSFNPKIRVPKTATVLVKPSPVGAAPTIIIQLPKSNSIASLGESSEHLRLEASPSESTMAALFGSKRAKNLEGAWISIEALDLGSMTQDATARWMTAYNDGRALNTVWEQDWQAWRAQANAIADGFDRARIQFYEIDALFGPGKNLDRQRLEPAFDRIRSNFNSSVELMASLQSRWNEEILPPLTDLIDRFKKDCAIIQRDYQQTMALLHDGQVAWGSMSADLQIAGGQFRRSAKEITLMPWTLLGGAFADKSEQAQFNKIAQEIVRSTAELSLAVSFAQDLLEQDPKLATRHPELVELLNRWLTTAAAKQKAAGENLFNRLINPTNP